MRIGFSLPLHGSAAQPEGLITIAKRAEALGYESLWVWERLLAPVNPQASYPIGDGTHPVQFRSVLDPLEALTFVAGHTERIALGTSVLILPLYNPTMLARQLTTLDILSKGRLRIGLGVGWNIDEVESAGVPWAERGKRADEALQLLKALWTTNPVEFNGNYYHIPSSYVGPKPIQKPHPPIYLGAFTPAAMRRIAHHGNGWNLVGVPLASVPVIFERIKEMAREIGRDPQGAGTGGSGQRGVLRENGRARPHGFSWNVGTDRCGRSKGPAGWCNRAVFRSLDSTSSGRQYRGLARADGATVANC
jgi:probable F420-dependent oxidoreductase